MENKENISPEERLLKAIEDEERDVSQEKSPASIEDEKGGGSLKSPPGGKTAGFLKGLAGSFKKMLSLQPNFDEKSEGASSNNLLDFGNLSLSIKEIDLRFVNKMLIGVILVFLVFFLYSIRANERNVSLVSNAIANINYQINTGTIELFKTPQFYLSEVGKRNIFRSYEMQTVEKSETPEKDVNIKQKLKDIAQQFKIIGVSWGMNARVMLKDVNDNKTYFLKENQRLGATPAVIKNIQKKKVIIGLEDEEAELE